MSSDYVLEPPVRVRVCGQWHLVVPHVVTQRKARQETIELRNGTITHATCQTLAHAQDEPLSVPTAWATGFGIPREALRQACATLTAIVQRALLMAPVAPAPAPGPEQTATKLTPEVIASAPEVTPQEVVDQEALLKSLATLDTIEYDQRRDEAAQLLGVRVTTLDKAVAARRSHPAERDGTGTPMLFTDPEPWPEAVAGASLLDALSALYRRYVVLPEGAADILALWTEHTYTHAAAQTTPRVGIESPQKRCGKTTLLALMGVAVARPLPASNITPAALFRALEQWQPTMLIDEADTFLRHNDELRGVLNAGHTRSQAYVIRTVGENHEPRAFCVWAPVAVALIGKLPSTLADRAIIVKMRRKLPSEQVERLRFDRLQEANALRRHCLRWAQDHLAQLRACDPVVPATLNDREADNWRPLCAIAEIAGGDWPQRVAHAISALADTEVDDEAAGVMLLEDMRQMFIDEQTDKLASADVVKALHKLEERPWSEWGRQAKPITTHQIARLLAPFGIKPKTIRIEQDTPRGYEKDAFEDAWTRYLSAPLPTQPSTTPQHVSNGAGFGQSQPITQPGPRSATPQHVSHGAGFGSPTPQQPSNDTSVAGATSHNPAPNNECCGVVDRAEKNVADENPRSPASKKDCCGVADPTPGGEGSSIRVGDWVLPLSAEGVIIPDSEFPPPYLISKIEPGSDGALYAQFMENGKDWPLAQCERTDSPSPPPDDVEEF